MIQGDVYLVLYKQPNKIRPYLVLTATKRIENLNSITVAPLLHRVNESEITISVNEADGLSEKFSINISSMQTLPKIQVRDFVTHLSDERMDEVFNAIKFAFGFD